MGDWLDTILLHDIDHDRAYDLVTSTGDGWSDALHNLHVWEFDGRTI